MVYIILQNTTDFHGTELKVPFCLTIPGLSLFDAKCNNYGAELMGLLNPPRPFGCPLEVSNFHLFMKHLQFQILSTLNLFYFKFYKRLLHLNV